MLLLLICFQFKTTNWVDDHLNSVSLNQMGSTCAVSKCDERVLIDWLIEDKIYIYSLRIDDI